MADETYHEPGVALVEGEKLVDTPRDSEHAKDMLDPKRVEKREKDAADKKSKPEEGALTEHQRFPGQNVPRLVDEHDLDRDGNPIKGRSLKPKDEKDEKTFEETQRDNRDRDRIRAEEQQKHAAEEREKELDKIRKEEADKVKKESAPAHATANKK